MGSWDNFLEDPTYKGVDQLFWTSRTEPRQIQIVSTDISEPSDTSNGRFSSSQVSLDLNDGILVSDIVEEEQFQLERSADQQYSCPAMAPSQDRTAAENSLRLLDTKVRDMCNDLLPTFITNGTAPVMDRELDKIAAVRDDFRNKVRWLLTSFADELSSPEKTQWQADLDSTLQVVQAHKFQVLEKVSQLLPPAAPLSEYERESIDIKKRQLKIQEDAADSKKGETLAIAKHLQKFVMEKCGELDEELDQIPSSLLQTGDDQQVTMTMLKLATWKTRMESIRSSYQEFQTATAVFKLSQPEQLATDAAVERTKDSLADNVSVPEDEDLKRHLFSLDTSLRGEQVK